MSSTEINNKIINYLSTYEPSMIGIFGSYARGENRPDSDIDILVNLKAKITLLQLVKIERELSELIGTKVDLVMEGALKNQKLINYIKKDLQIIYK